MKGKTIKAILRKRFNSFVASIKDAKVRKMVEENSIITGGSIVSMLLKENVSDFDVYFRTVDVAEAVATYYVKELKKNPPPCFKDSETRKVDIRVERDEDTDRVRIIVQSAGIAGEQNPDNYQYFEGIPDDETAAREAEEFVEKAVSNVETLDDEPSSKLDGDGGERYRPLFVTSNAITLATKFQLVIRFVGEPEDIHKNYDFVHCTNYWTSWDDKLVLRPEALESILAKELRYVGSLYPICSMIRTRKFIKRGWTINAGQYVKMAWQIHELDLSRVDVLEDQLVGVDAAYFEQVIRILRESPTPDRVDGSYLMTVIDRLF